MTDERAKRFPLALADLVREPRKANARPDARSKPALKAISGGSGVLKSAAAAHKASAAAPKLPAAQIRDLAALRWLQAGESVILYGPVVIHGS